MQRSAMKPDWVTFQRALIPADITAYFYGYAFRANWITIMDEVT